MGKSLLVHGSLAYDLFFYYPGTVETHFVKNPQQLYLNFRAFGPEKHFGGCAGNAAYTLRLFNLEAAISSWVGTDGKPYLEALKAREIDVSRVHVSEKENTPTAVLLKDSGEHQWSIFGEPEKPVTWRLPGLDTVGFAVITSGMPERTFNLIEHLKAENIPYIIDPGKMIADIPLDALVSCIEDADFLLLNRYEFELLGETTNFSADKILSLAHHTIITKGTSGATIYSRSPSDDPAGPASPSAEAPAIPDIGAVDPYGAGDAFLAGFSAAVVRGAGAEEAGRAGAVAASFAVETKGSQNHSFSEEDFLDRYVKYFDRPSVDFFHTAPEKGGHGEEKT